MANQSLRSIVQHEAYRLVFLQLGFVSLIALLAIVIKGKIAGASVFSGGLAYVLPNLIFVWAVFRFVGARQIIQFLTAFFVGEMFKLIISAILFLIIVKYLPVSLLSVLVGFIGAIVSFWMACIWHFSRQDISKQEVAR